MKRTFSLLFIIIGAIFFGFLLHLQYKNFKHATLVYEQLYEQKVQNALTSFTKELEREEISVYMDLAFQELITAQEKKEDPLAVKNHFLQLKIDSVKTTDKILRKEKKDLISETTLKLRQNEMPYM